MKPKFAILLPFYNEEETLPTVCKQLQEVAREYSPYCHIIGINDGSTDDSQKIVSGHMIASEGHRVNIGVGYSLRKGIYRAMEIGCDFVITWTGNGKFNVKDIPVLIDYMEKNYMIVTGSRFIEGGEYLSVPVSRQIALKYLSKLFNRILGLNMTDPINGVRAYKLSPIKNGILGINSPMLNTYLMEFYILYHYIRRYGNSYAEIPVSIDYSHFKQRYTHIVPWKHYPPVLLGLLRIRFGGKLK